MNGSRNGALAALDQSNSYNGTGPRAAGKWLWRRGQVELWQDYARAGSGMGRAEIRYFVGAPGTPAMSFEVLHDACVHFCKVTHGK